MLSKAISGSLSTSLDGVVKVGRVMVFIGFKTVVEWVKLTAFLF
jgi:hypothetical protein